jgi:hypothetical protein
MIVADFRDKKSRQKTKVMCNIPILLAASAILEKYKDAAECTSKLARIMQSANE